MRELLVSDWFVWGVGLILGFQLLVILLGEAIYRAERRQLPIGGIFRALRNFVLPLAVLFVFLTRLLEMQPDSVLVRLVATVLWISAVYAVMRVFNVLVFENAAHGSWRSRAPKLFQDLVRLLLVVIGAAIVLSVVWRQDLGGLIAALGVGSIVLGLALQETLGNLMSGIALFFERPFTTGDWIAVGGESGEVVQITWRSVHLRTGQRNLLVLPNSTLGREMITNYSQPTAGQMLQLSFGFGLDAPPNRVKELLLEVAHGIPLVMKNPPPRAVTCEVLADRIRYEARVYIEHGRHFPQVVDHFNSALWYAARRAGLALPLPRSIELQEREAGAKTNAQQQGIESLLSRAEGIRVLPAEVVAPLAIAAEPVLFGIGERIIAAGEIPANVYVITAGEALGTWAGEDGAAGSIRFGPDEVLGVTSPARAQASPMQVVAVTDVRAIRIPGERMSRALREHPALGNQFARIWQARDDALRRSGQRADTPIGG